MTAVLLWAAITFEARGGRCEALLQRAADSRVRIRTVRAVPGGFTAVCSARDYLRLRAPARVCRVRLRVRRRQGLYFRLKSLWVRRGLFLGAAVFGLALLAAQNLVWWVDCSDLTVGQAARALRTLRACGIQPGSRITQPLLTAGEYALLEQDDTYSWVSLNFEKGRLTIEAAAATPIPAIDTADLHPLVAATDAVVQRVEPENGTPAVKPGQSVVAGQLLIGTARTERDGSLFYRRAAGRVIGEFCWEGTTEVPLAPEAEVLTGRSRVTREALFAGRTFRFGEAAAVPWPQRPGSSPESPSGLDESDASNKSVESNESNNPDGLNGPHGQLRQRHYQAEFLGLPLPVSICETSVYETCRETLAQSEGFAAEKIRLACEQQLKAQYPDAEIIAWTMQTERGDGMLKGDVLATVRADICRRAE